MEIRDERQRTSDKKGGIWAMASNSNQMDMPVPALILIHVKAE
jgi:hypothetical protein